MKKFEINCTDDVYSIRACTRIVWVKVRVIGAISLKGTS